LNNHHPAKYIEAIQFAEQMGFDVIIIDSLSHAWFAELDLAGGRFDGWKTVRPLERKLIDTMLSCKSHIIATMRSKTEYVMEEYTAKDGKTKEKPRKIGTSPIQSSGIEYEFDLAGDMDYNHILTISKSRCPEIADCTFLNPGKELADMLKNWIETSEKPPVWKDWKTEEDAILWASEQLPNWDIEEIKAEFDELEATNGKKAPAWVERVQLLTSR
jgi:hypothetical protein